MPAVNYTASTISAHGTGSYISDTADGFAIFGEGDQIEVSGFTNPSNNGVFTVTTATAGSLAVSPGVVDESAGPQVSVAVSGPLTIQELQKSRHYGRDGSVETHWLVSGSDSDMAVYSFVGGNTPGAVQGRIREIYWDIKPIWVDGRRAAGQWEATVRYTPSGVQSVPKRTGESVFAFEMGGSETIHITQAIATMGSFGFGAAAEDVKGAINVTGPIGEPHVEGVDIPGHSWPHFAFTKTVYVPTSYMSAASIAVLKDLVGCYNSVAVTINAEGQAWPFAIGECLFLGCRGARRGYQADWELSFAFDYSPNVADACINWSTRPDNGTGSPVAVPKRGWDYLWTRYQTAVGTKIYVPKPVGVYVDQVIPSADLNNLTAAVLLA